MQRKILINFTGFWHSNDHDVIRRHNPLYRLLSKRFELVLTDRPDFLIYSCFGGDSGYDYLSYDCVRIFYTGENIRPDFDDCDYAFSFDYPVTDRNYRLPLYGLDWQLHRTKEDVDVDAIMRQQRKFCNFVYSNDRARERMEFFDRLQQYKRVDSGGKVRNNIGHLVGDKLDFLGNYKFTIAFENESHPGYTTEKLLHAFIARTVPIYWGNPLVGRDFNPKAFINCHDYGSFEEVVARVAEIDRDDDLYRAYLSQHCFANGQDNEFINEKNVLDRFDQIFSHPHPVRKARKTDFIKRAQLRLQLWAGRTSDSLRARLSR
ncbi:glycosyltransferase family 10 domain-containing protein [Geomonas subterranea]|uniref:glycosyltransferase family 10 domain-containing protein n=1 Tax=Geomonas subterranea TaxID=2847989 RepID=UPI001CD6D9B5|nr:glycosyltransferase family 10 [Geomonas fuzhouensis]